MAWVLLGIAGVFEVAFAVSLKLSEGFTRPGWIAAFLMSAGISFYLLTVALQSLPVGTAYAVWTGIGAVGTAAVGILAFNDDASLLRIGAIALIVAGIGGLNLTGGH
ncbi:quaternary ammonium compound efflux SMR transporter SugE [soil metagenome]